MQKHVTLLGPKESTDGGLSSSLPPDLLEQVRGRVQLPALLILSGTFYYVINRS